MGYHKLKVLHVYDNTLNFLYRKTDKYIVTDIKQSPLCLLQSQDDSKLSNPLYKDAVSFQRRICEQLLPHVQQVLWQLPHDKSTIGRLKIYL